MTFKVTQQIMNTFKKTTLLFFAFCTIYSCGNIDKKDSLLLIINDEVTTSPSAQLVIEEDMEQYYDIKILDSVVFLTTSRGEAAIKAFSTKDYSLIGEFGYKGDGPEGVEFPMFMKGSSNDNETRLYDINYKSLIKINFNTERDVYTIKKKQMYDALWPSFNVNRVSDSVYFANGVQSFNEGLYFKVNINSSEKEWIPYLPEFKTDEEDKTAIYRNVILANEEKSIVVSVMKYFNRIFVFDFDGKLIKDIQVGEQPIEPVIEDLWMEKFSKDSDIFFIGIASTNTHFYCLWVGNKINYNDRKKSENNNSKVFVFDWNLNHVSTIQTEHQISCIDVDPVNKFLLAVVFDEEEDTRVYKYDIGL